MLPRHLLLPRRCFTVLLTLLIGVVGSSSLVPPAPAQAQTNYQMRAFWVDALNDGFRNHPQVDELVDNVVRANANTIIVQVRRHGNSWYNKTFEPRSADPKLAPAAEFDPLEYLLAKAHSRGIKVHAWLVMSVTCRDTDLERGDPRHICTTHGPSARGAERWTTATYRGAQVGDLDFGHPASIQYLENVVENLLVNYPAIDGIHYDYIRYGDQDYGYNQVSLDRFNQAYGRAAGSRPAPTDAQWSQWRRDRVTETVRRLYIRIKAINPQVEVSAATISWGGVGSYSLEDWPNSAAYSRTFQDWKAWLEEGILDFAVPMHYFADGKAQTRGWYDSWLSWDRVNTGQRAIVVGMGSWLNSANQNVDQINRAVAPDAAGQQLSGVAFFSYNQPFATSNPERRRAFMDQLSQTAFAQPAQAPVWPWVAYPTNGHLQGMATINGEVFANVKVSLIHEGQWVRDIASSADGWYGAVELAPGNYTIVIHYPGDESRNAVYQTFVEPGRVTSAS